MRVWGRRVGCVLALAGALVGCGHHDPVEKSAQAVTSGSSNASNFNGTPIAAGSTLWFSSVFKVSGVGTAPARLVVTAQHIAFTAGGVSYDLPVPDGIVTITPGATTATTSFDAGGRWETSIPAQFSGNAFLSALAWTAPVNLPGGINPVTWYGTFTSDTTGLSVNWQWAAAVYTSFSSDYNALHVVPVDDNHLTGTSDHAGTPEAFKTHVVGGARGGGGSNYTGSLSGTVNVTPALNNCVLVTCVASDACHVAGICDLPTGQCSNPAAPNGTACNDGNACTRSDTCVAGVCTGANPVVCAVADQCHIQGSCDSATGICSNPAAPDGTGCNDGNACTRSDTCVAGVCTGAGLVVCSPCAGQLARWSADGNANDSAGGANGVLLNGAQFAPGKHNQAFAFDGNSAEINFGNDVGNVGTGDFTVDFWMNSTSTRGEAVLGKREVCHDSSFLDIRHGPTLVAEIDDGAGNYASLQGTRRINDGAWHHVAVVRQGTKASLYIDGALQTALITAQPAQLSNSAAFIMGASACDGIDGTQPYTGLLDEIGLTARAMSAQEVAALFAAGGVAACADPCHVSGSCDPATGVCSHPASPDGTTCNDGNACTRSDGCVAGVCTGGNPVICPAPDPCHTTSSCDPASGSCSGAAKPDGTICDDGDACTPASVCAGGVCAGGNLLFSANFESGVLDWSFHPGISYFGANDGRMAAAVKGLVATASGSEQLHGNYTLKLGSDLHQFLYDGSDENHPFSGELRSKPFPLGRAVKLWRNVQSTGLDGLEFPNFADGYYLELRDAASDGVLQILERYTGASLDDKTPLLRNLVSNAVADTSTNVLRGTLEVNTPPSLAGRSAYLAVGFWSNDGTESAFVELDDVVVTGATVCDDGNPCTADSCDPSGGCAHSAVADGTACDDANLCTGSDVCRAGACAGTPLACDDGDPCTADSCDPSSGCKHTPQGGAGCGVVTGCGKGATPVFALSTEHGGIAACNASFDGSKFVMDPTVSAAVCDGGWHICRGDDRVVGDVTYAAVHSFPGCYPYNAHDDCGGCFRTCDDLTHPGLGPPFGGGGGCQASNVTSDSDMAGMGNGCTGEDDGNNGSKYTCIASSRHDASTNTTGCFLTAAYAGVMCCTDTACPGGCDDNNPCTTDTCDAANGCVHTPAAEGAACSDGNNCTIGDACHGGVCTSTPVVCSAPDACHAAGTCDAATGACSNPPLTDGSACSVTGGTGACGGGTCHVATCNPGLGDCDATAGDGCEATLTTPTPPPTGGGSVDPGCTFQPTISSFAPTVKYHWGSLSTPGLGDDIMMAPIVINLDDDNGDGKVDHLDTPEIVFTTFVNGGYTGNGTLHAISVKNGALVEKWRVSNAANPSNQLAGGDLDGDGIPEIVACNGGISAYRANGSLYWHNGGSCDTPAIADLDGDGFPEVIVYMTIYDGRTGATKRSLPAGFRQFNSVSDLDGDGKLDVTDGTTAFRGDGTTVWNVGGLSGGYTAVGDFDKDGKPEVIMGGPASNFSIIHYDPTQPGGAKIIRANVPLGTGVGGPPTVADFDGDGFPDVGIAGSDHYVVFSGARIMNPSIANSGLLLWSQPTHDFSSAVTGSSVFDFNGDGRAEVLYADELHLRIYDGVTGALVTPAICNTSGTLWEYPLVADVDNDGQADLIVVANAYAFRCPEDNTGYTGIRVFGSANGTWAHTRNIWNQHTYHVTNIDDDGRVPAHELPNWTQPGLNDFRQNKQPGLEFAAPDAVVTLHSSCTNGYSLVARVQNAGPATLPPGVVVGFYAAPSTKLGQGTTAATIPPGGFVEIAFPITAPPPAYLDGSTLLFARVETTPVTECRTDNNQSPSVSGACGFCGACGVVCNNPNGTTSCDAAGCHPACNAGFGDCDGDAANGCETELDTLANCGACGRPCSGGGTQCTSAACVNGACTQLPVADGTACDDHLPCTINDHCQSGTCAGAQAACRGGTCSDVTYTCPAPLPCQGFDDPTCWTPVVTGIGPSLAATHADATLDLAATSRQSGGSTAFSANYYTVCRMRGDFDVQVDFQLPVWPFQSGARVGLSALTGAVERDSLGNPANDFPGQTREVYSDDFGPGALTQVAGTDTVGSLRMVRTGNQVSGYRKTGAGWTLISTASTSQTGDTSLGVSTWSHDYAWTGHATEVVFSNFTVNHGEVVCPAPGDCARDVNGNCLLSIEVTPSSTVLTPGGTQTFTAVARDSTGVAVTPQPAFTWSASGGSIDAGGHYTASDPGNFIVTAAAGGARGFATVTVNASTPTIAQPASVVGSVGPDAVAVSVLGADAGGEAGLTYTWSATGPAPVAFAPNGNNAAKNSVATFSAAGTYVLTATITNALGRSVTSSVTLALSAGGNRAPNVDAGPSQTVSAAGLAQLAGHVSDDGLPAGATVTSAWSKLSGPGTVTFADPLAPITQAAFSTPGIYVLRLTATDTQLTSWADVTISVATNRAPTVSAGPNLTVTLPTNSVVLDGTVTDDGLPSGVLGVAWQEVSGPSLVTFTDRSFATVTAHFTAAGTYLMRLSATDSALSSSSDMTITVLNPEMVIDFESTPGPDGLLHTADDIPLEPGTAISAQFPGLTFSIVGGGQPAVTTDFVAHSPANSLTSGAFKSLQVDFAFPVKMVTLYQLDFDVAAPGSPFLHLIAYDAGGNELRRDTLTSPGGGAGGSALPMTVSAFGIRRVVVDYAGAGDRDVALDDFGYVRDDGTPPNQAPLLSAGAAQTITLPATALLSGTVSDDGLPAGAPVTVTWTQLDGPGSVTFTSPNAASTLASFSAPGTYTLLLRAGDTQLEATDFTAVTVKPVPGTNLPPVVNAGADQTLTLPAQATLTGSVSDDGLPAGAAVSQTWSMVSGPGTVTFATPHATSTSATFSVAGVYVLRLLASDTQLTAGDDVTVTVNAAGNQAPLVTLPAELTAAMPGSVSLTAVVSDDGLPSNTLMLNWTQVSGPGAVTFDSPTAAATNVTFPAPGTYVLRFTANDTALSASADVIVTGRPGGGNLAPIIYSTAITTATTGALYTYPVLAEDRNGDALTFTLPQAPPGMTIDGTSGLISWLPANGGDAGVIVRVTDSGGLFAEQPFTIAVGRGQASPRITSTPPLSATPNTTYIYVATASDPDDTSFTWTVSGPPGMSVDGAGRVTWVVPSNARGSFPVTLTVADPAGHTATQTFSIGVGAGTSAPVVAITSPADGAVLTQPVDVIGTAQSTALAGYTLQLCRTWGAADCRTITQGTSAVSAGKLGTLNPESLPDGTWNLVLTATDGAGVRQATSIAVVVHTGSHKPGVLRLDFPEMTLVTATTRIDVHRVYDGLDTSRGPLGNGWRFAWSFGHLERPHLLQNAWTTSFDGFSFSVDPTADHPITLVLDDGRLYQFETLLISDNSFGSVVGVRPIFPEISDTGATLTALRSDFTAYSSGNFDDGLTVGVGQDEVDEGDGFTPWEPAYYRLTTEHNENMIFDATTGQVVQFADGVGVQLNLSATGIELNGQNLLELDYASDGMVGRASNTVSGASVSYERNGDGDLIKVTTRDGSQQTFTYASVGRLLSYQAPGLGPERWEYDDSGRVTLHVNPMGVALATEYDDANRRVILSDAAGARTINEFDAAGNVVKRTDALGHATTFTWKSGTSLQTSHTDPLGHTWQAQFDDHGRETSTTDPLGHTVTLVYDPVANRATQATDGEGRTFKEQVDAQGRTTAWVLPDGTVARRFAYPDDHTIVETDPQGHQFVSKYDDRARVVSSTNSNGTLTRTYDDAHQQVHVTAPDGTTSVADVDRGGRMTRLDLGGSGGVFQYAYGTAGHSIPDEVTAPNGDHVTWQKMPDGRLTQLALNGMPLHEVRFDALGRVASERNDGETRSFRYDAAGRLTAMTTASGTTAYNRDDAGRLVGVSTTSGISRQYAYDDANQPIAYTDASGEHYTIDYDKSGRITGATDATGRHVTITYDANGRRSRLSDDGGLSMAWTYPPSPDLEHAPPPSTMTDFEGVTWSYTYDDQEQIASVADPTGGTTRYQRDATGMVSQITDPLNRVTVFTNGPLGLDRYTSPGGRVDSWTYDGDGRAATWTRADNSTVSYRYGENSVGLVLPGGAVYTTTTDPTVGAVYTDGAPGGATVDWLDDKGDTEQIQVSDGASVALTYAPNREIATVTASTPGGAHFVTRYGFDGGGKITSVTDPDGGITGYTYDLRRRVTRIDRPNGTHTELSYGALDRPTRVQHFSGGTLLSTYTYGYDGMGRLASAVTPEGSFQYEYDVLSRLSVERTLDGGGAVIAEKRRTYDAVGNLTTLVEPAGTTTYEYDRDDRLLSATGPLGQTTYVWTGRGALAEIDAPDGTTRFTWDDLDRLTAVTLPSGEVVSYEYDVHGRLMARTDHSGTRRCLPLPTTPGGWDDCAVSYSPTGDEAPAARVFGPGGLASTHGTAARYVLAASHGHVVATTDNAGTVMGSWGYDAWGNRLAAAGEEIGYGYTGERQDPATGLVFLRTRWYQPSTGRFVSSDRANHSSADPRDAHRYIYSIDDPLNHVDPSGEQTEEEEEEVCAEEGILSRINTIVDYCIKDNVRGQLRAVIVDWALKAVQGVIASAVNDLVSGMATPAVTATGPEDIFHSKLAQILCDNEDDSDELAIHYLYKVNKCGGHVNRRSKRNPLDKVVGMVLDRIQLNVPYYLDCALNWATDWLTNGITGIDIVVGGKLGVELKVDSGTMKTDQLVRFCRFGARTPHLMVFGYLTMPDIGLLRGYASDCWKCWNFAQPTCAQDAPERKEAYYVGSIFIGFAVNSSSSKRYFVPSQTTLCPNASEMQGPD